MSAGLLTVKDSDIHSHASESGVLVSEAEASYDRCRIYGNGRAGLVSQNKGRLHRSQVRRSRQL